MQIIPKLPRVFVGSRSDRLLLLFSLIAIGLLWWSVQQRLGDGPSMVYIYHGETLLARYPLQADIPVTFDAKGDIGISTIHIAGASVAFTSAPCRNHRCILSGKHHHPNDVLACVPNRILVVIQGSSLQGENVPDAIAE